jgi:mycothiol synthase
VTADATAGDAPFPPGVRAWRPDDEGPILAAMLGALERGELEGVTRHFLEESAARLAHEPDLCAVAVDDGRVAGWTVPLHDDLTVDLPFRRRGHGRRLVEAGRRIAARAGQAELRLWVPNHAGPEAFARAVGLRYHSSLWLLRLPIGTPVDAPRFPIDVVTRWIEPGTDDAAFVDLVNDAFADHPSPLTVDLATIRRVHGDREFDPSTIMLVAPAAERGRLVGFCRIGQYPDDEGRVVGEVKLVGVRREARGRGLGRALVGWGVAAVRERGVGDVFLSVEGDNAAALGLYESIGFRQHVEWPHWTIPAADPGASRRRRDIAAHAGASRPSPSGAAPERRR